MKTNSHSLLTQAMLAKKPHSRKNHESNQEAADRDIFFDLAWKVFKERGGKPGDEEAWNDSCDAAYSMLRAADFSYAMNWIEEQFENDHARYISHVAQEMVRTDLSRQEQEQGSFGYRRACQLVTRLKNKTEAVAKFEKVLLMNGWTKEELAEIREHEIDFAHVAEMRAMFLKAPKHFLRKSYERKGLFTKASKRRSKK